MDQKLRTERRKLADLKAAEYNPRKALTPDDAEYQKIRRSIEEFGYVDPIIINEDGTIIGGPSEGNRPQRPRIPGSGRGRGGSGQAEREGSEHRTE